MERTLRSSTTSNAWYVAFLVVAVVSGAALIFRGHLADVIGPKPAFLRTYALIIGPCELATALLLVQRALRLQTRRATLLAAAYVVSAPLVIENLLTLPGIVGIQLSHQTPPWCWTVWHFGWALFAVAFAWSPDRWIKSPGNLIAVVFVATLAFGFVAAHADSLLPPILLKGDVVSPLLFATGWSTIGLLLLAAFGLAAYRGAALDAWLLVAVFVLALDEAFVLTNTVRFSIGTYLARVLGAINAVAVLIPILLEPPQEPRQP
jgi:hypothetical protein